MAGLFLWSGRHDEFSNGQKREIHSVSALRKIPMHGGGSELAAGLNHVMRGPRGSESLSEKIDFTLVLLSNLSPVNKSIYGASNPRFKSS